nr:hypothetical protein CFP56_72687 [Quercus suber]
MFQAPGVRLTSKRTPAHDCNRDPDQIRVSEQTPTFHEIGAFAAEPLQRRPQSQGDEQRISIHQPGGTRQELEVIREMSLALLREVRAYRTGHEQDDHHGRRDPERTVQVGVSIEDVQEVLLREERAAAAVEDLRGVDVEELLVVVQIGVSKISLSSSLSAAPCRVCVSGIYLCIHVHDNIVTLLIRHCAGLIERKRYHLNPGDDSWSSRETRRDGRDLPSPHISRGPSRTQGIPPTRFSIAIILVSAMFLKLQMLSDKSVEKYGATSPTPKKKRYY